MADIKFPEDFYLDDVGVWRLKKEKLAEMENPKPLTNEAWLRSCNTEQLVHVIHLMTSSCYVCGMDGVDYRRCYFRKKCTGPKEIEEWLKDKHEEM